MLLFVCPVLCSALCPVPSMSWDPSRIPPWWPASPSGSLATPSCCCYNLWYTFLALGFISMLLLVVLCLLTPCVIRIMYFFNNIHSLLLGNTGIVFKSFWCGGSHPISGTAQGHVGKKNVCVSRHGDAELIGVTSAWYSGFGWSGFVGWGVILLLCAPLVAGETLKNPIPDHASEDTSEISLHPFLSPYAHLSIPGFLALGLVLPRVVPHLGGYRALGSLAEALTWGVPAVSAVAGFNSQALYQHILYWFGYRPYS